MTRAASSRRHSAAARNPRQPVSTRKVVGERREACARMLGNGLCTRPAELDCRMESACETCAYFRTGTQFQPIVTRQRDHPRDHGQSQRAALFDGLIQGAETERS